MIRYSMKKNSMIKSPTTIGFFLNRYFFMAVLFFSPTALFAWGGRGHHSICDVAVYLVKTPELREFLQLRPQIMGHLCNVPDIYWKGLGADVRKAGDPTHYIEGEVLGLDIKSIPSDYQQILLDYTGKPNKFSEGKTILSVPGEAGSSWWRVDQFMRRISDRRKLMDKVALPDGKKQEFDEKHEYNQLVFASLIDMGLMGHYVGDNSQPFHTTSDYDGWKAGHGGIHSYYEETVVGQFDGDFTAEILRKARAMEPFKEAKSFLTPATPIEKMRALSLLTNADIQKVYKLDPIIKKSELKEEKGMQLKTPAVRKEAEVGAKIFRPMIVRQMARSALLLANLWDQAYLNLGKPTLKAYKSYQYPFTPDFVAPDYTELVSVDGGPAQEKGK